MDTIDVDKCEIVSMNENVGSSSIMEIDCGERVDCLSPNKDVRKINAPYVGMIFDSTEGAKKYYEEYGRQEGFCIRVRSSSRTIRGSNAVTGITYVCIHEGKHTSRIKEDAMTDENEKGKKRVARSCSTFKCGCEAYMRIVFDQYAVQWKVSLFNDDHNHKVVMPSRRMKMKPNRNMPSVAKDLTETISNQNLQINKIPSILRGNMIGFDGRDCYNHLQNVRRQDLEKGDAQCVLEYFIEKQNENPQFFYGIQCDEDGRAINFFWVDARSRLSYEYFGDVVTFDTTYRTNKYKMPFVPFTGVNHHFQSIQFGCALIGDETETTFVWLFEMWLKAMRGKHPISIITNQDLAMSNAIAKVFPNSRHRLCIWHIRKKFAEKLSHKYLENSTFRSKIKKCIWSTYTGEEFEKQWQNMIQENGLEDNDWLQHLFEIRKSWVPTYNRTTFFAGMNTTGCNKSINAFFNGFVNSTTNLREFVVKYEEALKNILKKESDEDYETEYKFRCVNNNDLLLKHAAKIYTRNIFEKLKEEWVQVFRYKVERREMEKGIQTFLVKTKFGEPDDFILKINVDTYEGTCGCKKFEFFGIICRHFLKVFTHLDIDVIPSHFIIERWKQGANKFRVMDVQVTIDGNEPSEALRFGNMCKQVNTLASYASSSMKAYTFFTNAVNDLSKQIYAIQMEEMTETIAQPNEEAHEKGKCNLSQLLLDSNIMQTKGRKNDEKGKEKVDITDRLKSSIELSQQKKKRKCAFCHKLGHDKRICLMNPNRMKKDCTQEINDIQELGKDMESDHEVFPLE